MAGHFIVGYFSCFWSNENVFYFSVSFSQLCFYFYLICRKCFHLVIFLDFTTDNNIGQEIIAWPMEDEMIVWETFLEVIVFFNCF